MLVKTKVRKGSGRFMAHGVWWDPYVDEASMQLDCIRAGGKWENKTTGEMAGEGLYYHFRRFQEIVWQERIWRKGPFVNYWAEQILECWLASKYLGIMGCAACVRGSTKILNPVTMDEPTISELCSDGKRPIVMTSFGPELASVPFVKGVSDLYEVTTQSGRKFTSTLNHLVSLTTGAFSRVSDLQCGQPLLTAWPFPLSTTSDNGQPTHASDDLRFWKTEPDFQSDCQTCFYSYDEPLPFASAVCQGNLTLQVGAPERISFEALQHWDGRDNRQIHNPEHLHAFPPSTHDFVPQEKSLETFCQPRAFSEKDGRGVRLLRPHELSVLSNNLRHSSSGLIPGFFHKKSLYGSWCGLWGVRDVISSIKFVGTEEFYDLNVPHAHHYYADGFIHHNSSKSDSLAAIGLTDWYAFPDCTTTLVSSTDLKMLELRVWGMVKKYHKSAKQARDWIPGHLIEGKLMIIQDQRSEFSEGRDFKNGIIGVPCKKGNQWVGLGSFIGIHNKRVRVIADESNLMVRGFLDSTSNLSKCPDFKLVAPGNPNETTNAHGVICEPAAELGGWEGGIDQTPGTKTWKTRFPDGLCLQLPGSDSPNLKASPGEEVPFPFLITRQQMEDDAHIWGRDDWHYAMFTDAKMPRGQGSRRVVTRQICDKFGAVLEPFWRDSNRKSIAFLDAAYRGTGGDRCVFGELQFGLEAENDLGSELLTGILSQKSNVPQGRQILALIDMIVIPIKGDIGVESPEDQIVKFVQDQCTARGIPAENFFYDSGMRTSLVTAFSRMGFEHAESVDCGGRPTEDFVSSEINQRCCDYYQKKITELWYSVRYIIEARQFRGLNKDVMWELCAREWKHTAGTNKIEVESKEEMKVKTGRSPDLADALAVGCFGARQRGFQIARLMPKEDRDPRKRDWRDEIRDRARNLWASGQLNHAA